MRAAPALALTLTQFGAWHAALIGLALGDIACLAAWTVLRPEPMGATGIAVVIALGLACIGLAASARGRPRSLRWDGQAWHLGAPGATPDRHAPGQLFVRLDLGRWMLLQFVPDPGGRRGRVWLPVQYDGAAGSWHALRCAVFSPTAPAATSATRDAR